MEPEDNETSLLAAASNLGLFSMRMEILNEQIIMNDQEEEEDPTEQNLPLLESDSENSETNSSSGATVTSTISEPSSESSDSENDEHSLPLLNQTPLYSEQKKCCNDVAMWIDWSISP